MTPPDNAVHFRSLVHPHIYGVVRRACIGYAFASLLLKD